MLAPFFFISAMSCSVTAVRPSQEMSNMEVSLKAALEVNADLLAPEIFRLASETALLARKEYRFKNFMLAKKHADDARVYAERAEFEAIRNGAKRETVPTDPLAEPSYAPESIATPAPPAAPTEGGPAPKAPGGPGKATGQR